MRSTYPAAVLGLFLAAGCAENKPAFPPETYAPGMAPASAGPSASITNRDLIVTLESGTFGKVAKVDASGFVVLNFPLGHIPPRDKQLSLYRRGLKVGEVKVTGPQLDDNTIADVVTGNAVAGDEARER
jgi:hypothetical protein